MTETPTRCAWPGSDPLYLDYHDREWGVPVHDDRLLFEFLILEGAQAGLAWITILRKRDAYRRAYGNGGGAVCPTMPRHPFMHVLPIPGQ